MKSKKILLSACISMFFVLGSLTLSAQPGGDGPPPDPDDPGKVPITGIEVLLVAGAALGVGKFASNKKKN